MTGLQSLSQLLKPLQPEVCLLDLPPASCTGLSCDPTCHSTHTRQQNRNCLSFASPLSLLPLPFSPFLSLSSLSYLSPWCPSLLRCPSAPTCLESCVAQDRRRFPVPVSTLARTHARLGRSHDLPREPRSRDQGKLLVRVPSQSLIGPLAGGLYLRQLCTAQRLSPKKRACHQGRCRKAKTWIPSPFAPKKALSFCTTMELRLTVWSAFAFASPFVFMVYGSIDECLRGHGLTGKRDLATLFDTPRESQEGAMELMGRELTREEVDVWSTRWKSSRVQVNLHIGTVANLHSSALTAATMEKERLSGHSPSSVPSSSSFSSCRPSSLIAPLPWSRHSSPTPFVDIVFPLERCCHGRFIEEIFSEKESFRRER